MPANIIASAFNSGVEGWVVGDLFAVTSGDLPTYVSAGGVDGGGYIRTGDVYGYNAFRAPSWWLGDQTRLYGHVLDLSLKVASSDGFTAPLIVLSSGSTRLQYRSAPPGTDWTTYHIPIAAGAGWELGMGAGAPGPAATEADMLSVLANLDWIAVNADWQTGEDDVSLDAIGVSSPEPSSIILGASGVIGLLILRFRRCRQ